MPARSVALLVLVVTVFLAGGIGPFAWRWTLSGITGAPRTSDVARFHPEGPVIIAHRGASGDAPENTLAAFREAIAQGAVAAEVDVHLSLDRAVLALHDRRLDRTTSGEGWLATTESGVVRALDAGAWKDPAFAGERVPTLGEVLETARGSLVLCVELKSGVGLVQRVREVLEVHDQRGEVILFSFDADRVALVKALMPEVPALWLISPRETTGTWPPRMALDARTIGADLLGLEHTSVDAGIVTRAHRSGLPVFVWTVDDPEDILRMAALGVDGIITNYPARARALLRQAR